MTKKLQCVSNTHKRERDKWPIRRNQKKRARQILKKTEVNKSRRSRIRTFVKIVEETILKGDKDAAKKSLFFAEPEIQRGVSKGIIKKNTAARKISRLSSKIKAMA